MTVCTPVLYVLDFDGVVCDGLDECMLTAWIVSKRLPISEWTVDVLDDIPAFFRNQFRRARNFVRHDGHFLIPFITSEPFQSSEEFEALYTSIDPSFREEFKDSFQIVRNHIRQSYHKDWIALHRIFDPMLSLLKKMQDACIVSGKDAVSISAILAANGVNMPPEHIFGSQTSKISILSHLKKRAVSDHRRIVFCDDNLPNVLEAKGTGIDTFWALWGYHTDKELGEAKRLLIQAININEVEAVFGL